MADKTITADEIVLGPAHGQHLRLSSHGIMLRRSQTQAQAWVYEKNGTPYISLFDQNGTARIELFVDADGTPCLNLNDGNGATRFRAWLTNDGEPYVELHDAARVPRLHITLNEDNGTAALEFMDNDGERQSMLAMEEDGVIRLSVKHKHDDLWEDWTPPIVKKD